ncbi:nitroreductase family protein, partial [Streptomyces chartreusis]|uniref:nitroreductase family protein n=1 Tax=Streptomyces chartreusis TaxID=1969 RepID=UPI00380A026C
MRTIPAPGQEALSEASVQAVSHCVSTLRSIRRFLPVDVDQESVEFVLHHAVQAGSAKNRQPWRFVVVRSRDTMSALGNWYRRGWLAMSTHIRHFPDSLAASDEHQRQMREGRVLADLFDTAPVVVVPCFIPIGRNPANFYGGASIYPAIQNLLLAARAIGLGATLTTLQSLDALDGVDPPGLTAELRTILGIPVDVVPAAVIPLGWPATKFAEGRREPVRKVAYAERWGSPIAPEAPQRLADH